MIVQLIEFDVHQHYYDPWQRGLRHTQVPVFAWLDQRVGAYNFYKSSSAAIHGQGWQLRIDWQESLSQGFVGFDPPLDDKTAVEFALRWA